MKSFNYVSATDVATALDAITQQPGAKSLGGGTNLVEQNIVELDLIPNTYMRAPGEAVGTFGLESAIDELSYRLGIDPNCGCATNLFAPPPIRIAHGVLVAIGSAWLAWELWQTTPPAGERPQRTAASAAGPSQPDSPEAA